MNVILSNRLKDGYDKYKVVTSLKEVGKIEDIDCLVLHSFSEEDFEVGMFLSSLAKSGIKKFAYISSNVSLIIKMVVGGLEGLVEDADFYFESEEDLDEVLDGFFSNEDTGSDLKATSEIIADFIKGFVNNDDRVKTPVYLEQVNNAVNELVVTSTASELAIKDMSRATVETFKKVSKSISAITEQYKDLEEKLYSLDASAEALAKQPRYEVQSNANAVWSYPTYQYMGSSKILYIREYSPCRYLTSFVLAYANYVNFNLQKKCKVVFIYGRGAGIARKYSKGFTNITSESENNESLYDNKLIATNVPKKPVMDSLTHTGEALIIIVDRLYGGDSIVSGQRITKLSAVSGVSDITRYSLALDEAVFPIISVPDSFCTIKHINSYPKDDRTRKSKYFETMKDSFAKLDQKLGI